MVEMITGKPPWADIKNPIAVFLHVGATNEPPKLPNDLSEVAKDFILSCFKRDPRDRLNVY